MHISTFTEFPLSNKAARQIIKEILSNDDSRFFMTRHAIDRMNERGITGWSAGTVIDVTVALRRVESDPHAFVMTVKIPH